MPLHFEKTPRSFNHPKLGDVRHASHASAGRIAKLSKTKDFSKAESATRRPLSIFYNP